DQGRPQAPHHRALPDRLHGVHGRGVARAGGRARRHVHRGHDRADRRPARPPRTLPSRLARRPQDGTGRESRPRSALRTPPQPSALAPGERGTGARLAEHDGELLHWFYDQGLVPGTAVELRSVEPEGTLTIDTDNGSRAIEERAAAGLFVRPAA